MAELPTNKQNRPYISSRFVLEIDDDNGRPEFVGTLQSIDGGSFKSDVIEEKLSRQASSFKYAGRPKFEDVTITMGMSMAPRFWAWINASLQYKAQRLNGALVALDYDNRERWRRNFQGALIRELTFPSLDGGSKEPAYLSIKFAVEDLKEENPRVNTKHTAEREAKDEWPRQQLWLPSMFSFRVDGLTQESAETCKVDGFTIKQEVIDVAVGGHLINTKEPGRIEFPALSVTILQRDAAPWMKWWDESVRNGKHEQSKQKTGHISYLPRSVQGPGLLTGRPLLTLDLHGLGILGVSPVKHESKQAQLQRIKLDLFVESMELKPGEGTVGGSFK